MIYNRENKIAITGIGTISATGIGYKSLDDSIFNNTAENDEVIDSCNSYRGYHTSKFVKKFDQDSYLDSKDIKFMDRNSILLCIAINEAIEDAGLDVGESSVDRIGIIGCSSFGSLKSICDFDSKSISGKSPLHVNPIDFPKTAMNFAPSYGSIITGITGYNTTILCGFTSGMEAISHAVNLINMDKLDSVIIAGSEEISEQYYLYYNAMGMLPDQSLNNSKSVPFDLNSNGLVLGEGAAALVVERVKDVKATKRKVRAVIRSIEQGFQFSSNKNYHNIPSSKYITNIIKNTLENASLHFEDVDLISSSANGWHQNDVEEANAIKSCFDNNDPYIIASKSLIGETVCASNLFATILGIYCIDYQYAPPIKHLNHPVVPLNYIVNKPKEIIVDNILIPAVDPNGNCMCMALSSEI